jgi:hypothetical protein
LTSHSTTDEDLHAAPSPEALARQLLAAEFGDANSTTAFAAAGERAYLRLRERLAILLGTTGFETLWARAMYLAQRQTQPEDAPCMPQAPTPVGSGLAAAVRDRAPLAAQHYLIVIFTRFISLLFTFIGGPLSTRFMRQIWPQLAPPATELRVKEAPL